MNDGFFIVHIRYGLGPGVRDNAKQLEGGEYYFTVGWPIEDRQEYAGEWAMLPRDESYPKDAPTWIASGDLSPSLSKQRDGGVHQE